MGGDTGKIIGYVALAAAVVYTGGAAAGYWGAGSAATAGAGAGAVGTGTTGLSTVGAGSMINPGTLALTKSGTVGLMAPGSATIGGFGAALPASAGMMATGAQGAYAHPGIMNASLNAGNLGINSAGNVALQTANTIPGATSVANPGMLSKFGSYVAENPLSSYFLGSGALNQMTAPGQPEMPMPDFTSLAQQQTYDQTLATMEIGQLNSELLRPDITPAQSNSIKRAMQNKGMSIDQANEAEARAKMGEERYAEVSKTMGDFRDATTPDQDEMDAQAALIYATYKEDSDQSYDDVRTQLTQNWANAGRLNSRGGDDAFAQVTDDQVKNDRVLRDNSYAEALRRRQANATLQKQGVDAILAGANYGDTMDKYNFSLNESNRRHDLGRNDSFRDQNYNTALLGQQGQSNYDLAKYKNDAASANAQALQGLESVKLGMGFYNNPLGTRV